MRKFRLFNLVMMAIVLLNTSMLGAVPALAETRAWDQDEVMKLADEFVISLSKISLATKTAAQQETVIRQRMRDGAVSGLGRLSEIASGYAKQLHRGRGHSATELYFEQVRELFHNIRSGARDAIPAKQQRENIAAAEKLLDQLAEYYDD
ncbi:MAG: hypothetical protein IH881_14705 [Myxococcales bacterium]|nr:hypothetical protein [Myxococcales bacterium]